MSMLCKWVGIPFRWGGNSFAGADCAGLVLLYLRKELGIDLPRPGPENRTAAAWRDEGEARMLDYLERHCVRVQDPRRGDIVLIHMVRQAAHVGVFVDSRRVLHVDCGRTSSIDQLDMFPKHRIIGFWRPGGDRSWQD